MASTSSDGFDNTPMGIGSFLDEFETFPIQTNNDDTIPATIDSGPEQMQIYQIKINEIQRFNVASCDWIRKLQITANTLPLSKKPAFFVWSVDMPANLIVECSEFGVTTEYVPIKSFDEWLYIVRQFFSYPGTFDMEFLDFSLQKSRNPDKFWPSLTFPTKIEVRGKHITIYAKDGSIFMGHGQSD